MHAGLTVFAHLTMYVVQTTRYVAISKCTLLYFSAQVYLDNVLTSVVVEQAKSG